MTYRKRKITAGLLLSSLMFGSRHSCGEGSAGDDLDAPSDAPVEMSRPAAPAAAPARSSSAERTYLAPMADLYRVTGIFYHETEPGLSAVVLTPRHGSDRQKLYWTGDAVGGGVGQVVRIEPDRAHFLYCGKPVELELEIAGSSGPAAPAAGALPAAPARGGAGKHDPAQPLVRSIDRLKSVLDSRLGNLDSGDPSGYKVRGVEPNSTLARIGLQEGDVVVTFNGASVRESVTPTDLMKAIGMTHGKVSLGVRRNGQDVTLEVEGAQLLPKLKKKQGE